VELAASLEHVHDGEYARVRFSREELNEIRYASLLHDFGKVGVREPVLVKAEKLYPYEIETLRYRFDLVRARLEADSYKRRVDLLARKGAQEAAAELSAEAEAFARGAQELDELFEFVMACNKPTVLPRGGFERLEELRQRTYSDGRGNSLPLLTDREIKALAIPKGSLSETERTEIESHVTWTYRFLSQIPWTRTLRSVPDIAYAHHEKLDGKGYPRKLQAPAIPVQSRMMAISDIFDALTASDRPYKKALPAETALDILRKEAEIGQLDKALYEIFLGRRIWEMVLPKR